MVMEKGTILKSAFSLIFLIFLFAGCSGKPSQSTIEELYVKNAKKHAGLMGQITDIKNFSVKDGLLKDNVTYIADVGYDLVFKMSFDDAAKLLSKGKRQYVPRNAMEQAAMAGLHQPTPLEQAETELKNELGMLMDGKKFKAGDKIPRTDQVTLFKKDKGWSLEQ
jgi:hypothetical protein